MIRALNSRLLRSFRGGSPSQRQVVGIKIKFMAKLQKAFSLIEVIFGVFVISIGLAAATSLMTENTRNSMDTRDSIVALQLAQEGIELVRNLRDNNWESGRISFDTAYFPTVDKNNCRIDYDDADMQDDDCGMTESNLRLYLKSDLYYQYGSAAGEVATKYFRKIKVDYDPDVSPTKATITSFVKWDGTMPAGVDKINCLIADKCIYAEDVLTKWGE